MYEYLKRLFIENLEELKGFHNKILKGTHHGKTIIIRISDRRSKADIEEEIYILNKIKDQVKLGQPYAINGDYVFEEEGLVYSFFEEVKGKNWFETTLHAQIHFAAGKELGKLHLALSKMKNAKRASFEDHPDLKLLSEENALYQTSKEKVLGQLKQDKNTQEFGLIHGDYLFSNLLYLEDEVTIIDFDDMEYGYYLYDIAVYLFYLLLGGNPSNIEIIPNIEVFKNFILGYREVNQKTVLDFTKIQTLFRLRQLKLFSTIKAKFDQDKLGDWQKNYLAMTKHQLENDLAFVDIDYQALAEECF